MRVRAASLLDLGAVERLHQQAGAQMPDSAPPVRLWSLISQTLSALLPLTQETLLYVCEEDGHLTGFIQATSLPPTMHLRGATNLQILNLCVEAGGPTEAVAHSLVDHLCNQALGRGVRSLFVRLRLDDPLTPVFRTRGFRQYATELVLYSDAPRAIGPGQPAGIRPARGRDGRLLYQLYRKVTPMGVAQVEAPSYREWRGLKSEWSQPPSDRGEQGLELVVDRTELAGWLRLRRSAETRPHGLSFLSLPEPPLPEELADHALGLLGEHPGPAWSSLRHYDSTMIDALRTRGFTTIVTQALLVRDLAQRVHVQEKGLVPSFG